MPSAASEFMSGAPRASAGQPSRWNIRPGPAIAAVAKAACTHQDACVPTVPATQWCSAGTRCPPISSTSDGSASSAATIAARRSARSSAAWRACEPSARASPAARAS